MNGMIDQFKGKQWKGRRKQGTCLEKKKGSLFLRGSRQVGMTDRTIEQWERVIRALGKEKESGSGRIKILFYVSEVPIQVGNHTFTVTSFHATT